MISVNCLRDLSISVDITLDLEFSVMVLLLLLILRPKVAVAKYKTMKLLLCPEPGAATGVENHNNVYSIICKADLRYGYRPMYATSVCHLPFNLKPIILMLSFGLLPTRDMDI